jgi:hypothetical protein
MLPSGQFMSQLTLQNAYKGGHKIDVQSHSDLYKGVLIHSDADLGRDLPNFDNGEITPNLDYWFAVSGQTLYPDNPHTYPITTINPNSIIIRGSGTTSFGSTSNGIMYIGFNNNAPSTPSIRTSGTFIIQPGEGWICTPGNDWTVSAGRDFDWTVNRDMIAIILGNCVWSIGDQCRFNGSDQMRFQAWGGSGILDYRFGPYEGWHTTVGAGNTDLVPIPHSGQVLQMILENGGGGGGASTLQEAYDNGQTIFIDGAQDLQFAAGAHKFKLGTDGDKAEISMSGLLTSRS